MYSDEVQEALQTVQLDCPEGQEVSVTVLPSSHCSPFDGSTVPFGQVSVDLQSAEQPSAGFLQYVLQVPGWAHRLIYDVGNICLLAGVLLFPFGRLQPRTVLIPLALLPLLFLLQGEWYRITFMLFMAVAHPSSGRPGFSGT